MRYSEKPVVNLCAGCNYDEVYYEPKLHAYFCATQECYRVIQDRNSHALAIVCQNPSCRKFGATPRIRPDGRELGRLCDDCVKLIHGPEEYPSWVAPLYCSKCKSYYGFDECNCKTDFLYGGPIVICTRCHKQVVLINSQSGTGFAGGMVYIEQYSCGHGYIDESADMRAAI